MLLESWLQSQLSEIDNATLVVETIWDATSNYGGKTEYPFLTMQIPENILPADLDDTATYQNFVSALSRSALWSDLQTAFNQEGLVVTPKLTSENGGYKEVTFVAEPVIDGMTLGNALLIEQELREPGF